MNTTCLVTLAIGNLPHFDYTIQTLNSYANAIRSDFYIIQTKLFPKQIKPHFEKLQLESFLNRYHKVLYIDSDVVISPHADNIFDAIDSYVDVCGVDDRESLGCTYNQYRYSCMGWGDHDFPILQNIFGKFNRNPASYLNTGVLYFSNKARKIFQFAESGVGKLMRHQTKLRDLTEQTFFNYCFHRFDLNLNTLNYRWNHSISEYSLRNSSIDDSFFIHFMGDRSENVGRIKRIRKYFPGLRPDKTWILK